MGVPVTLRKWKHELGTGSFT